MAGQDVHLIPLWDDARLAVLPLVGDAWHEPRPADRVVLLVPTGGARLADAVATALPSRIRVERVALAARGEGCAADFLPLLQQMAALVQAERRQGNTVHVNASSGSRLVALAASLAAMAHLGPGSLYHAQVEPRGAGDGDQAMQGVGALAGLGELACLPIALPDPVQHLTLELLRHHSGPVEYRDILAILERTPGTGFVRMPSGTKVRAWTNAGTTRMVRRVLAPLRQRGLVELESAGRARGVRITWRGLHAAALAGHPELADVPHPPARGSPTPAAAVPA